VKAYFLQKMGTLEREYARVPDHWVWSEKLDGRTAFWDGGITRGMPKSSVSWANTAKDARYKTPPVATGLWSSNANVINAPKWWLGREGLLGIQCGVHGELWAGRGKDKQQFVMSTTAALTGDARWADVQFWAYDIPWRVFDTRRVDTVTCKIRVNMEGRALRAPWWSRYPRPAHAQSMEALRAHGGVRCVEEYPLGGARSAWIIMEEIAALGGEGIVVRDPDAVWTPIRTSSCLKVKPSSDGEAVVIGWTDGTPGSEFDGVIGALRLRDEETGVLFDVSSGLTMDDRRGAWRVGDRITFAYRTRSADGVPIEARYIRRRDNE
jgi:DNA ligase-1